MCTMSTGHVVLDIKNLEHVPTLTPADQNPTNTSNDDKSPIQEHVQTLTPADENPTPTSNDDESPMQENVPTLTRTDENPTPTSNDDKSPIQEHVYSDEESLTSGDESLISKVQIEIEKSIEEFDFSEQITKIQLIPEIMAQSKVGEDCKRARAMTIGILCKEKKGILLKHKLAAKYIRNSGKTSKDLLVSIKNEIKTLSTCFHNEVCNYNGRRNIYRLRLLARVLFLDGCSIFQFIYSRGRDELKKLQINNGQASLIEQDLFLMENQIPFRVLEILMDQLPSDRDFSRTVLQRSIHKFIGMNLMTPEKVLKGSYLNFYDEIKKKPVHLLDILRSGLLYGFDSSIYPKDRNLISENNSNREYFCNIQELKSAGIKLESSGTSCLRDVTFTSFGWFRARLKIPSLIVNDATECKLWNLVAYEMCPENCNSDFGVTSYVSFLDSLIDSEEDVKELRSAGILKSRLGSDKEVAKLFNEIGYNTVSDTDQAYRQVKQKIQMHFAKLWPTAQFLIVQFKQEHFRSPWTFIALLGSIAVLALTATQTYFTINPTK